MSQSGTALADRFRLCWLELARSDVAFFERASREEQEPDNRRRARRIVEDLRAKIAQVESGEPLPEPAEHVDLWER